MFCAGDNSKGELHQYFEMTALLKLPNDHLRQMHIKTREGARTVAQWQNKWLIRVVSRVQFGTGFNLQYQTNKRTQKSKVSSSASKSSH